jgi:hypothetical protein
MRALKAEAELAEARREIRSLNIFTTETLRDAARYRWLRDVASDAADSIGVTRFRGGMYEQIIFGEDLDAAIDAARGEP